MAKVKKKKIERKSVQFKGISPYYYLGGLCIAVIILYLISTFYYTGGYFSLPIDDVFAYLQYAKQLAKGELWAYNSGDTLASGVRSILYLLLLTPGHFLGLEGNIMVNFSFILGAVLFTLSIWLTFNIGRLLFNQMVGMSMAILLLLHGPTSWGYLSGSDTGLLATSILATLYSFILELRANTSYTKTLVFASLMSLAHPEGIILAAILGLAIFCNTPGQSKTRWLYSLIPVSIGVLVSLINLALTNSLWTTAFQSRSFLCQPNTNLLEILERGVKFYAYFLKEIVGGFGGDYAEIMNQNAGQTATYFAPFAFLFFLIGCLPLAVKEILARRLEANLLIVAWFLVGTFVAALAFPDYQSWVKQFIPYYPIFIISVVIGIYHFSQMISLLTGSLKEGFYSLNAFFLIFFILGLFHFAAAYGKGAKDYYHQEIALCQWVKDKIPVGVKIATVGSRCLKYLTPNYVLDLSGGVNKELTLPYRNGVGAVVEQLEELKLHPECIILPKGGLDLSLSGILSEQLYTAKVVGVRAIEPLELYKTDWSLSQSGDNPQTRLDGEEIVDQVDVASLKSEAEHKYYSWEAEPGLPISTYAYKLPAGTSTLVLDGGRSISGGERMLIKTKPAQALKIIMRTAANFSLRVIVNNKFTQIWVNKQSPGNTWVETICLLPGQWIVSDKTEIHLQVVDPQQDTYTPAHYWFVQR